MHGTGDDINFAALILARFSDLCQRFADAEMALDDSLRLNACHDGDDLERHAAAAPLENPFLEEPRVVATHELKATGEVGLDPAVDVFEPLRQRSAFLAQALVGWNHVAIAKSLDHH